MQTLIRPENRLVLPAGVSGASRYPGYDLDGIEREVVNLQALGILPGIGGGMARGTNTVGDVLTQTADGRSLDDIWDEFQLTVQIQNDARSAIVNLLTFDVNEPIEDVPQGASDDFEEASEFGVPKGIRGGSYFSLGYDFKWYDLAVRYTWQFLAEAKASQVEALNNQAIEADNRLLFMKVMRALFNNVNRVADIRGQAINVYALYNNDGTTPPNFKNNTFASTHNHYVTSGAATIDGGDLDQLETLITEHGYGAANGSTLVLMVNRAQSATIKTFRVATGSSNDFIPAVGGTPFLLPVNTGGIANGQAPATYKGLNVLGTYGNWTILEDDYVPAGYIAGFATGGEMQANNPVGLRQHAVSSLRGLRLIKGNDNDYPLIDSYYQRGFGTGIRQRGAAAVMQITAAGAYTIPAAYV